MAFESGIVTDSSGSYDLAHQNLLELIEDRLTSSGFMGAGSEWVTERSVTSGDHEIIMRAPGLAGTEEIYCGIKLYHSETSDYYNCKVAGMTGYVESNPWETQPGISPPSGVPLHNQSITYWLVANGQRVILAAKVGTPVYESFYLGRFLAYASPGQYPYPHAAIGMLNNATATRFSDTTHSMGFKGSVGNCRMRFVDGFWHTPNAWPWINELLLDATPPPSLRESPTDHYPLLPIVLCDGSNIYGELDGVFQVTGFNNAVENTVTIGGVEHLVVQDVFRTGFRDYFALRLE